MIKLTKKKSVVYPSDFYIDITKAIDRDGDELDVSSMSFYIEFFNRSTYSKIIEGKEIATEELYIVSYDGTERINNSVKDGVLRLKFENYPISRGKIYYRQIESYSNNEFSDNSEDLLTILDSKITITAVGSNSSDCDSVMTATLHIGACKGDNTYDVVIRTQTDFDRLVSQSDWGGARSVAFIGGDVEFTRSDGAGVFIPDTVTQIKGFNNATIKVTNFVYSSTNIGGLWRNEASADTIAINDLRVECTGGNSYGFVNCNNLTNCHCDCDKFSFSKCQNLINCNGGGGASRTFSFCTNLINCTGNDSGNIFSNCTNLINCNGIGTSFPVYNYCYNLTNCSGEGDSIVFRNCTSVANCNGSSENSYAFELCKKVRYCRSTNGLGYNNCYVGGDTSNECDDTFEGGWNEMSE